MVYSHRAHTHTHPSFFSHGASVRGFSSHTCKMYIHLISPFSFNTYHVVERYIQYIYSALSSLTWNIPLMGRFSLFSPPLNWSLFHPSISWHSHDLPNKKKANALTILPCALPNAIDLRIANKTGENLLLSDKRQPSKFSKMIC